MKQDFIDRCFFGLLLFTLLFGVVLYDAVGFDYTDECCALCLFLLFFYHIYTTPDWRINKTFLFTLSVFLFYVGYSLYIGSNAPAGILTDLAIQIKPYLAFFCVFSMKPRMDVAKKTVLRDVAMLLWVFLLLVGIGDLFVHRLIYTVMGHPAYYAASVIATSMCLFLCRPFTVRNKILFLLFLSIGLLSGRSKFYGFYAFTAFVIFFFSNTRQIGWNLRNGLILLCMIGAVLFVAREKIYFYFYQTVTEEIDKDMVARYVLYTTAPEVLHDYFPFGSGLASYGTYASGLYYSPLYEKYGIEGVYGMTKSYYSFIADTYYPSLAQFGVAGILLYIGFWMYILKKAFACYRKTGNIQLITLVILITGFFGIEGTTDSTFTSHRGFLTLMLLGMILGWMEREKHVLVRNKN